ncbi:MAG: hypothetical protein QOG15_883 [Solirubrobacteraceae bacterium]|jgi:hypothetical protein|nr:hypothetical protein [Solirubrobacteraceae bacterium]
MRTAAVLCALLVAVSAAGCGAGSTDSSKGFSGEKRTVAKAVENFEQASRDGNEKRICTELLSGTLLAALKKQGTNCTTAVKEALKDTDSFDLKVKGVTISGPRASVKVESGSSSDKKTDTLTLEREGSTWKISSLGAAG